MNTAIEMKVEADAAASDAAFSAIVGAAGAAIGSSSKSVVGKVAGWSAAGAGAGKTIGNLKTSGDYEAIANSVYALAMGQLIGSINLIQIADSITANVSEPVKKALNSSITEWKKASLLLYKAELIQLSNYIKKYKNKVNSKGLMIGQKKEEGVFALLATKQEFKELSEVKVLADLIGLDNHKSVVKIGTFFTELKNNITEEGINESKIIEKRSKIGAAIGMLFLLLSLEIEVFILPAIFGLGYFTYMYWIKKSSLLLSLNNIFDNFSNYLESVEIQPKEIEIKLLGQ